LEVKQALTEGLKPHGISAQVESQEAVNGTKRRFWVVAADFEAYDHAERQDIVWRIVEHRFPRLEDRVKITMILTMTPNEMEGNYD
jgi:hypothetical protein